MPETFALALPPKGSKTTTTNTVAGTKERPLQPEAVEERQATIDFPAPQATTSQATTVGMTYMSANSI